MALLRNEFSWSKSRMDIFRECPRKYYYYYYGSWGGWSDEAPERTRRLYVLKQLKNRWMWAGEVVHKCLQRNLQDLLRGIRPLDLDQILELTRKLMRSQFRSSREGAYWRDPKSCALFEHEYRIAVPDEEWKLLAQQVMAAISNFFHSYTCKSILSLAPEQIREVENFSSFTLDDLKVNVKLDFCYAEGERLYIYDWKTGKGEHHSQLQLVCYGLYAQQRWGVDFRRCHLVEYNLAADKLTRFFLSPAIVRQAREQILDSSRRMSRLLADERRNIAREEDFPRTGQVQKCHFCNFRRVCQPAEVEDEPCPAN